MVKSTDLLKLEAKDNLSDMKAVLGIIPSAIKDGSITLARPVSDITVRIERLEKALRLDNSFELLISRGTTLTEKEIESRRQKRVKEIEKEAILAELVLSQLKEEYVGLIEGWMSMHYYVDEYEKLAYDIIKAM